MNSVKGRARVQTFSYPLEMFVYIEAPVLGENIVWKIDFGIFSEDAVYTDWFTLETRIMISPHLNMLS